MSSTTPEFTPFKRGGTGNFSERAEYCHQTFIGFGSVIMSEFEKVRPSLNQIFTIADYGTADGGASYPLIRQCIVDFQKKYSDDIQIQVIFEDQPINDFKPVFVRANGLHPGFLSLTELPNVYVLASGTSFYHQCVPDNSLDFLFSSTAMHWLSRCPLKCKDEVFAEFAPLEAKAAYRKQAEEDWETFLVHRSKELKPGGRMVLLSVKCNSTTLEVLQCMSDQWKRLLELGIITEREVEDTNFSLYFRTIEDLRKPFKDEDSLVCQTDLKLIFEQTMSLPALKKANSQSDDLSSINFADVSRQLDEFTEAQRAWTEHILYSGLNKDRTEDNKNSILDSYYKGLRSDASRNTQYLDFSLDYICLVVEK